MTESNGNNVKDWVIRRRESKSVMVGYDSVSTIAKQWVNYDGLASRSLLKVRSSPPWKHRGIDVRFETSQVVGNMVEKHNISPFSRIMMELVPGLLLYPRVRSKQKITTGQKSLTNSNSTKSFSDIRAKLEPSDKDTRNDWSAMEGI